MNNIIKKSQVHNVEIVIKGPFINLLIMRLYRMNINISNIKYINTDTLSFITKQENLKIIRKEFKDYKVIAKKEKGIYLLKPLIQKNKIFLLCLILGIGIFFFLQNIIVKVDVIHSDKTIRELVNDELEDYGIKRLTFKKDYNTLQEIKKKILEKYPDRLEWIEIENIGMTYKVRVEERIITKIRQDEGFCNIVAKKSGIITKIINKQGLSLLTPQDYVSAGDIIIAGDIKVNEELKKSVCAKGQAYAEVWYTVNTTVPLNKQTKIKTGKKRLNFMYDTKKEKKVLLKSRFKNKKVKNKKIFSLWGINFYLQEEYEVILDKKKLNSQEAKEEALKLAEEKINLKLSDKERIITKNILKTSQKDSKMNVEIFVSVEEEIGKVEHYEISEDNEKIE